MSSPSPHLNPPPNFMNCVENSRKNPYEKLMEDVK